MEEIEMFNSKNERKNRYSIRKYSVGVASVVIASFFLGSVAHAETYPSGPVTNVTMEERRVDYPTMELANSQAEELKTEQAKASSMETSEIPATSNEQVQPQMKAEAGVNATEVEQVKQEETATVEEKDVDQEQLKRLKEGTKETVETTTSLSPERKAYYKRQIDAAKNYSEVYGIENDFNAENAQLLENEELSKSQERDHSQVTQDAVVPEILEKIDQELDYQKAKIEKMAEQKGITTEEKEAFIKNIEAIRKKAYQDAKGKNRNTIEAVKQEVMQELSKTPQLYKASLEKEIQDHVNKLIEAKDLNEAEVSENEEVRALLAQEKEVFEKLDKATTNTEALQIKNEFLAKVSAQSSKTQKEVMEQTTSQRAKRSVELEPVGDEKVLEPLKDEAKVEIDKLQGEVVRQLADKIFKRYEDDAEDALEIVKKKTAEIADSYKDRLSRAISKAQIESMKDEAQGVFKSVVELSTNHIENKTDLKDWFPAQAEKDHKENNQASKPKMEDAEKMPADEPKVEEKKSETDKQMGSDQSEKLQSLVKQGLEEITKLEKHIEEVKQYPELKNTPDYKSQTGIWNDSKKVAPEKVEAFKKLIKEPASKDYTEKKLKDFVDDFIYYQIHAQIESISRQVAIFREKYPNVGEIERLFVDKVKQTDSNTYATLEGEALKKYFNDDILPAFKKIQEIVAGLEKKETPSEESKKEPATPTPPTPSETPKMERKQPSQPGKSAPTVDNKKAEKLQSAKPATPSKPQSTDKATDISKLKEAVKSALNKLDQETMTVPDGAKLIGEAEKVFKAVLSKSKETLEETKKILDTPSVTAEQLATQLSKVNDTLSELKEAKGKLVPKTPSTPENSKKDTPKKAGSNSPTPTPSETPKMEGQQPSQPGKSTPTVDDKKSEKPSSPQKDTPTQKPQLEKEIKPQTEASKKHSQAIFHANTGQHHITVAFDKAIEADKVDFKEVTSQAIVDTVIKKTGEGKVQLFDISLSKDGQKADVDGERLVRLVVDQVGSDVQVYHVKENGELELIPSTIVDGQIVFKTKHFSLFAVKSVAQSKEKQMLGKTSSPTGTQHTGMEQMADKGSMEMKSEMSTKASKNQTEKPFTKTSKIKAVLPNTGTASSIVVTLIGLFTLVGALVLAKKVKKDDESL